MIASRRHQHAQSRAANTACPRGQACGQNHQPSIAFGAELSTPALRVGVDNSVGFTAIADT